MSIGSRSMGYPQQMSMIKFVDNGPTLPPSTGDPDLIRIGDVVYLRDVDGDLWPLPAGTDPGFTWTPRAIGSSNVTLSGLQTIDGVALVADNLAWLLGQSTNTQNGPWIVKAGAWQRPDRQVAVGQRVIGSSGSWNQAILIVDGSDPITYGVTSIGVSQLLSEGPSGGPNKRSGLGTLVAGVATISNISLYSVSTILVTRRTPGGTAIGHLSAPSADRTNALLTGSFKVRAYKADGTAETADISTFDWLIVS